MAEAEEQAKNETVAGDSNVTAPPADEPKTPAPAEPEGQAEQAPINEPAPEAPETDAERKPKRAERRIHQLNDKVKQLSQPNQPGQGFGQSPQLPQYVEGDEVSPERLQADVVQTAQAIAGATVEARIAQERANTNFVSDRAELEKDALLDENSPDYLPEIEKAITEEFSERAFKVVGYNPYTGEPVHQLDPSVRLADIGKRHLSVAKAAAKKSSAEMKNAVARTEDEAAIKPGTTSKTERPFSELSIKEMEAHLGTVRQ